MSNIKITRKEIDKLLEEAEIKTEKVFDKCLVVTVQLPNGFILTESSACVDPENYDEEIGYNICMSRIEEKIWMLEGYALQKKVYEGEVL